MRLFSSFPSWTVYCLGIEIQWISYVYFISCNFTELVYYFCMQTDTFISSSPIWMPFISSSCLISLTRTSIIMLIRSDKSKPPCLMPDLRGKAFSFSPINYGVTCGLLIYAIYCVEIRCFYTYIVESFNCK